MDQEKVSGPGSSATKLQVAVMPRDGSSPLDLEKKTALRSLRLLPCRSEAWFFIHVDAEDLRNRWATVRPRAPWPSGGRSCPVGEAGGGEGTTRVPTRCLLCGEGTKRGDPGSLRVDVFVFFFGAVRKSAPDLWVASGRSTVYRSHQCRHANVLERPWFPFGLD